MKVNKKELCLGIVIIILSSFSTCIGQLMWKLSTDNDTLWLYLIGFVFYGLGALLMIIAFKFGELSILHPMMSIGYILSIFIGATILHEAITWNRILGIGVIVLGMFFLGHSGMKGEG
ncbi:membrane protein [Anaerocolumna cellulosilytica]|uniref:Membrane protein n=1 Tax=Anaerocolumna cellulosilytica TaxID=433286 RepID=A0A6S6R2X9_9FIRM|nr:EamA family transporter [Anaerocolumna cellulosilytica]MBB5194443.1 undecaprenyl phosphate-alpha-L-ara4N flippase subunit ArnE [Anaerocolumna cellulosilytica]BCJ93388.1 membrane protein [Anaerocolumna cellulosilytica]